MTKFQGELCKKCDQNELYTETVTSEGVLASPHPR